MYIPEVFTKLQHNLNEIKRLYEIKMFYFHPKCCFSNNANMGDALLVIHVPNIPTYTEILLNRRVFFKRCTVKNTKTMSKAQKYI